MVREKIGKSIEYSFAEIGSSIRQVISYLPPNCSTDYNMMKKKKTTNICPRKFPN
jgi:hypothetical protein